MVQGSFGRFLCLDENPRPVSKIAAKSAPFTCSRCELRIATSRNRYNTLCENILRTRSPLVCSSVCQQYTCLPKVLKQLEAHVVVAGKFYKLGVCNEVVHISGEV